MTPCARPSAALFLMAGGIPYLVDSVTFGPQTTDVSLGRVPAGECAGLRFALGSAVSGPTRVGVYDLRGRLVREILREDLPEGEHAVVWDRRDRQGRRAAAGVDLLRVTTGGASATVKLGLVR